ncbi:MAG: flagellar motor switch protein FliN [Polyangiaceae bacterium]
MPDNGAERFPDMDGEPPRAEEAKAVPARLIDHGAFHMLRDVEVEITVEIGRIKKRIADVLRFVPGQTVELDKVAGEPVDIYVNDQLLGRGEAVVVGDRYGVRITELLGAAEDKS